MLVVVLKDWVTDTNGTVTANLLVEMLKVATVDQLVMWTMEPKLLPKMTFGKHRGSAWAEVPLDYLQWMTSQRTWTLTPSGALT